MNRSRLIFLGLLASLVVPLGILLWRPADHGEKVMLYCAAGMRKPLEIIARRFEEEYGIAVDLQYGGSGTLLGNVEASGSGDLYLAADSSYIDIARKKGLADESIPVAYLSAGFLVAKGNPFGLASLADLAKDENLRISMGNPEAASIGKFTRKILEQEGLWESVSGRTLVTKPTVNELANDVKLGAADVAVVWDAVAKQYPDLDFVRVPAFDRERKDVTITVLRSAENVTDALRFARYVGARDRGLRVFEQEGYAVAEGDRWAWRPELVFFSGAMLRPAITGKMERFQEREGVDLQFVPNGCGVLVAQMRAGARPDAYFSCDQSFMTSVQDLFEPASMVSSNDMVILAHDQARPEIRSVRDLTKPGLRVGVAHPEKSALGALTNRLLGVMHVDLGANKILDSATGDFLVNQLRAGSLDAVIVYRSNAMAHPTTLKEARIVEIDHPRAVAHQPFAVGANSDHKHLMNRLFQALVAADGRAEFLKYGFRWELKNE